MPTLQPPASSVLTKLYTNMFESLLTDTHNKTASNLSVPMWYAV